MRDGVGKELLQSAQSLDSEHPFVIVRARA
jgi:hypothetical protein